jgi:hypothetical protein
MPHGSTRPIPTPLRPDLVDLVRAHGWELAPAGWLRPQLDDRDRLRQQLQARAPRPTRGIRAVPWNPAQPAQHDTESTSVS